MKKETYVCDRCGAELGEGYAPCTKQFATETQFRSRIKFYGHWNTDSPILITHDLCEKCRNSLDKWLEGKDEHA